MVIVKLTGGVGNQLFAYAAGRALAKRLKTTLRFDTRYYLWVRNRAYRLHFFNTSGKGLSFLEYIDLLVRPHTCTRFQEKTYFSYDPRFENVSGSVYLDGWWQNPQYFQSIRKELHKELEFRLRQSNALQSLLRSLRGKTTVSLHIRRGDYTKLDAFGTCSQNYYKRAIRKINEEIPNATYVVSTDDMEWVQKTMTFIPQAIFVQGLPNEVEELYVMSRCSHHIIANSTFSWWGSVLAKDQKGITIAPTPWVNYEKNYTKDLYMENWILIPRD